MQPSGLRPSPTDAAAEKALDGAHWAPAPHRKPSAWIAEGPNRGPQALYRRSLATIGACATVSPAGAGDAAQWAASITDRRGSGESAGRCPLGTSAPPQTQRMDCRRPQSRAASFSIEEAPRRQERSRHAHRRCVGEVLMFLWYKTGVPFDNPVRLPLGEGEKGA